MYTSQPNKPVNGNGEQKASIKIEILTKLSDLKTKIEDTYNYKARKTLNQKHERYEQVCSLINILSSYMRFSNNKDNLYQFLFEVCLIVGGLEVKKSDGPTINLFKKEIIPLLVQGLQETATEEFIKEKSLLHNPFRYNKEGITNPPLYKAHCLIFNTLRDNIQPAVAKRQEQQEMDESHHKMLSIKAQMEQDFKKLCKHSEFKAYFNLCTKIKLLEMTIQQNNSNDNLTEAAKSLSDEVSKLKIKKKKFENTLQTLTKFSCSQFLDILLHIHLLEKPKEEEIDLRFDNAIYRASSSYAAYKRYLYSELEAVAESGQRIEADLEELEIQAISMIEEPSAPLVTIEEFESFVKGMQESSQCAAAREQSFIEPSAPPVDVDSKVKALQSSSELKVTKEDGQPEVLENYLNYYDNRSSAPATTAEDTTSPKSETKNPNDFIEGCLGYYGGRYEVTQKSKENDDAILANESATSVTSEFSTAKQMPFFNGESSPDKNVKPVKKEQQNSDEKPEQKESKDERKSRVALLAQ